MGPIRDPVYLFIVFIYIVFGKTQCDIIKKNSNLNIKRHFKILKSTEVKTTDKIECTVNIYTTSTS